MKLHLDGRFIFLIKGLVALSFLSKISFGSVLPIPKSFLFLIFQQGMHPFLNIFFCFLLGTPLLLMSLKVKSYNHLSGFYKLFLSIFMIALVIQTLLQIKWVNTEEPLIFQIGAMGVSLFLIAVYGVVIPSLWTFEEFVFFVQKWSGILVLLSLALWFLGFGGVFKGGRFIGVFKHIPHMVTCATVAFVFSLSTYLRNQDFKRKLFDLVVLGGSFFAIILTGTRSSAAAAVAAFVIMVLLHRTTTSLGRLFKFATISFAVTFVLFFGVDSVEFAYALATGQTSLGSRQAQDGIESRWEEIERGREIFLRQPWLGQGLVSKFASGNEVDVSNYNAMKDPHNLFVSAGVIGGWPFLLLSGVALMFLIIGSIKSLFVADFMKRQIAIYLLCHIPILVIYHVHLSLGGMADRIYWLVFGFVAATSSLRDATGVGVVSKV